MHCIVCDDMVRRDSVDEIAAAILALGEGTRLHALFPVETRRPPGSEDLAVSEHPKDEPAKPKRGAKSKSAAARTAPEPISDALKPAPHGSSRRGFNRLYQQNRIFEFSTPESLLELDFTQPVFVLVDRIAVSTENRARIVDAAEIGYRESGEIRLRNCSARRTTSSLASGFVSPRAYECKHCHRLYREPEPRLFSFNNPYGACPRCQGFGNTIDFDLNLIIPDKAKTLDDGAIDPWTRPKYRPYHD